MMRSTDVCIARKWKGLISGFCGLLSVCLVVCVLTGCPDEGNVFEGIADDGSYEARIEEVRIALDDGDYLKAYNLLVELKGAYPNDRQVLQYLSNACSGMAGIDTFRLLEVIDQLIKLDQEGKIDMVGLVLGGPDTLLTSLEIDEKINLLEQCAMVELESIPSPTNDNIVQLGLVAMFHAALTIANIVVDDLGLADIDLTEEGLISLYCAPNPGASFDDIDILEALQGLSEDVARIDNSIVAIMAMLNLDAEEKNDLSESFDEFLNNIDPDGNLDVTQEELEGYINSLCP